MIKCRLNTEKDVASVDETKISAAFKKESKSGEEDLDKESPKVNSQPKEGIVQNIDSLNNNKSREIENTSNDVKIQDSPSSKVKKKNIYKKKVAKLSLKN